MRNLFCRAVRGRKHILTVWVLVVALGSSPVALAQTPQEQALSEVRRLDRRVAAVGHRLATANRDLCSPPVWRSGLVLHHISQYAGESRSAAREVFQLAGRPAVLAVAAGGPADRSGIREDDSIVRIDGRELTSLESETAGSFAVIESVLDILEEAFSDGIAEFELRRGEDLVRLSVRGELGCATRFQLVPSRRVNAYADGVYVQVTSEIVALAEREEELAAVLAHELAHNILRHRRRLDAAGVPRGVFRNLGRNARLVRETEREADRLSVYLLDRAGYAPEAAPAFWRRLERRGLNFLGSPTHGGWNARIRAMEAEIEVIRASRATGVLPFPPVPLPGINPG